MSTRKCRLPSVQVHRQRVRLSLSPVLPSTPHSIQLTAGSVLLLVSLAPAIDVIVTDIRPTNAMATGAVAALSAATHKMVAATATATAAPVSMFSATAGLTDSKLSRTDSLTAAGGIKPRGVHFHTATRVRQGVIVIGGKPNVPTASDAVSGGTPSVSPFAMTASGVLTDDVKQLSEPQPKTGGSDVYLLTTNTASGVPVWSKMKVQAPLPSVEGHSVSYIETSAHSRLYLYGGRVYPPRKAPANGGGAATAAANVPLKPVLHSEVFCMDAGFGDWSHRKPNSGTKPPARVHHTSVGAMQSLLIFGGLNSSGAALNDVHRFDTSGSAWSQLNCGGDVPPPRAHHTAHLYGSQMVVFGGTDGSNVYSNVYTLDLSNLQWTQRVPQSSSHAAAETGAASPSGYGDTAMVISRAGSGGVGMRVPAPRIGHASELVGHQLIIFGGHNPAASASTESDGSGGANGLLTDCWIFDLLTNRWTESNVSAGSSPQSGFPALMHSTAVFLPLPQSVAASIALAQQNAALNAAASVGAAAGVDALTTYSIADEKKKKAAIAAAASKPPITIVAPLSFDVASVLLLFGTFRVPLPSL